MAKYDTVSVKVPTELKERAARLGVRTAEVLRRALEEEVRRREVEEINKELHRIQPALSRITAEEVVASIREDRDRK